MRALAASSWPCSGHLVNCTARGHGERKPSVIHCSTTHAGRTSSASKAPCWPAQAELAKARKSRLELQHRMQNVVHAYNTAKEGLDERKRTMKEKRKWVRPQ